MPLLVDDEWAWCIAWNAVAVGEMLRVWSNVRDMRLATDTADGQSENDDSESEGPDTAMAGRARVT